MAKSEYLLLFQELESVTRKLSNEQFGILVRAAFAYRFRGERYCGEDIRVDQAFESLANQLDRDEAARAKKVRAAEARWERSGEECKPMHPDANHAPFQSSPFQSSPVHSSPVPSCPEKEENTKPLSKGKGVPGAAAPTPQRKQSFGKYSWVKLSLQEHEALERELGEQELSRCIAYLDEACQMTGNKNRWKDFAVVIRRCAREGWGMDRNRANPVPMGCTGLGEAELRNIQRALKGGDDFAGTP